MINRVGLASGVAAAAMGGLAYAVRGRSSQLFGPSAWRGPRNRRAIALTFDDGPSEGTPAVLELLARYAVPATFFQCGANVRRLPQISRLVAAAGHEIGNHSDTHPPCYLRSGDFIYREFHKAQQSFEDVLGRRPNLMRAPFGARWFGFRRMQRDLQLTGVMWSVIARDWTLGEDAVAQRVLASACNGAIACFHDGRELNANPDIRSTLGALGRVVPELIQRGFEFETASRMLNLVA